jgi:hypothetical protein
MDYFVRYSQGRNVVDSETGRSKRHVSFSYLPATDKRHAILMVEALNMATDERHGVIWDGAYDVVASLWTGKGRVYLDLIALEQIADEHRYLAVAQ